ncbi:tryptophan-rich sensory protein TspO [Phaeovulum vinaykumarii]|uniref:TspO and MBR related proteins n=1 Tax=Phaeovulum vinaykumarii TaxID=407234 RepID=A0A1N7L427_9RHOB|nr:TspO/MBR family protein [Phaeovulum vinaykumarii]SIS68622.1 TspO and MBR related proteins [Phaeovulum vinaykumarii]SOB99961.1 TspO/MBR related protein [Phaeovulum vinaykumarii]
MAINTDWLSFDWVNLDWLNLDFMDPAALNARLSGLDTAFGVDLSFLGINWLLFLTFLAGCAGVAWTGAAFKPGEWYKSLAKPLWTPGNWVFPVVWFVLYILMSYAAMRVAQLPESGQALALFTVQTAFAALWTPMFFGKRRLFGGLIVVVILWLAVAATTLEFMRLDQTAGLLMVPYVIWATLAALLNLQVWLMNMTGPRGEKVAMQRAKKAEKAKARAEREAVRAKAHKEKVLAEKAAKEAAAKAAAEKAAADKAAKEAAEKEAAQKAAAETPAAETPADDTKPEGTPAAS